MFLSAVVARYHRENENNYNKHDAALLFIEAYNNVREFEEHLDTLCLDHETTYDLPECIQFDSLVFALNSIEWEIMWSLERKRKAVNSEPGRDD